MIATIRKKYSPHATAHQPKYGFRYRDKKEGAEDGQPGCNRRL